MLLHSLYAAENVALTAELARYQQVHGPVGAGGAAGCGVSWVLITLNLTGCAMDLTAAENVALTAELARYQQYVDRSEREALLGDVEALRGEVLRLQDSVGRLSAAPQVSAMSTPPQNNWF